MYVPDVSNIHARVVSQSADITAERQLPGTSTRLTATFSAARDLCLVALLRDWEAEQDSLVDLHVDPDVAAADFSADELDSDNSSEICFRWQGLQS